MPESVLNAVKAIRKSVGRALHPGDDADPAPLCPH